MSDTTTSPSRDLSKWLRWLPAAVFFVALAIRLLGIGWGLKNDLHNQSYHPDEPVIFSSAQQIEPAQLKFTPGFYNYGTLYLTILRVASDVTSAYTGAPDPKNPDSLWSYVSRVHEAGRIISALAGAGTVVAVFLMLRRRVGDVAGLAGSLLIAFAPGHVMHSRFQTVDVLAVFFLALSTLFALRLLDRDPESPAVRDALLAGLFAGLSAGTKYTGLLALATLAVVLVLTRRKWMLREGLAGLGVAVLAFVIVTPGVVLDNAAFMRDFRYEMAHTSTGHGLVFAGTGNGFVYQLTNLWTGVGAILTSLGLIGLAIGAVRRQPWILAILAFFLLYFVLIGRAEVRFLRYTFPLYVGLAAGFAYLLREAHQKQGVGKAVVVLGILGLGGVDARGLVGTVQGTIAMVGEDSRDRAVRYVRQNAPPNASVGLVQDPWTWNPPFFTDATSMRMGPARRAQWLEEMRATSRPQVALVLDANNNVPPFDPRLATDLKPDYITFSSLEFDARERLAGQTGLSGEYADAGKGYLDFMRALSQNYDATPVQFGSAVRVVEDMEYVDPVVLVWKRKATP